MDDCSIVSFFFFLVILSCTDGFIVFFVTSFHGLFSFCKCDMFGVI